MLDGDRETFSVDATSGVVTLHRTLDRETQDVYTLVVRATDTGTRLLLLLTKIFTTKGLFTPSVGKSVASVKSSKNPGSHIWQQNCGKQMGCEVGSSVQIRGDLRC